MATSLFKQRWPELNEDADSINVAFRGFAVTLRRHLY